MKKTKFISLTALVLCLVTVLASCGSKGFLDYLDNEFDGVAAVTTSAPKDFLKDKGEVEEISGNLIWFSKSNVSGHTHTVYNLKTDRIIATMTSDSTETFSINFDSVSGVEYFTAITLDYWHTVTKAELYDANGNIVATSTKSPGYKRLFDDFKFGNKIFSTDKNGTIVQLGDASEFFDYISISYSSADFIYVAKAQGISVYDKFGNPLSTYPIKTHLLTYLSDFSDDVLSSTLVPIENRFGLLGENVLNGRYGVLQNGNIYIQYLISLPEDAEKYDVYLTKKATPAISSTATAIPKPAKYNLLTEIFDIKDGSVKEVDVDFVFDGHIYPEDNGGRYNVIKEDFEYNLAGVRKIEDGRAAEGGLVILDNKLKIKENSAELSDGIALTFIECISDGAFCATDTTGRKHFIFDGSTRQTVSKANYNEKYIYTNGSVYDYNFESKYDLAETGYIVLTEGSTSLLLGKKSGDIINEAVLLTSSGSTVMLVGEGTSTTKFLEYFGGLYGVQVFRTDGGSDFVYYNEQGAVVATLEHQLMFVMQGTDGTVLAQCGEDFYRFAG